MTLLDPTDIHRARALLAEGWSADPDQVGTLVAPGDRWRGAGRFLTDSQVWAAMHLLTLPVRAVPGP